MKQQLREAVYFFYSQAFADGFRATFAIVLPALIGAYTGHFPEGLAVALGAMCVSLCDAPGPIIHKRNGMLFSTAFAFMTAIVTPLAQINSTVAVIEVAIVTFLFSMFVVYGNRATSVGNTAILIMILSLGKHIPLNQVLPNALFIMWGGLFYLTISLLLYSIRPYRYAQRALGESIREVANYLSIRADFYRLDVELEGNYSKMIAQQIVVNEKQDLVREVFFKTRQIVNETTNESRKLVFTFVETVDLFEDITATYYDYKSLRNLFGETGALQFIYNTLKKVGNELSAVGAAIQNNTTFRSGFNYDEEIISLKTQIDAVQTQSQSHKLMLHKIIVNIRNMLLDLDNIEQYFQKDFNRSQSNVDHSPFVSHQPLDPAILLNNLNMQSSVFRHALRVSLASITGYLLGKVMPYSSHSYWILLTIAFIIKPAYALTKQRNVQRVLGTVIGAAVGVAIVMLVANKTALFFIMLVFMLGTYSFMRINYLAMVLLVTPYVVILFGFLGGEFKVIAGERVMDTIVGCAIAFSFSYFLFPKWEADEVKRYMREIVQANALYLHKLIQALSGEEVRTTEYKLARKSVYLSSANLSAAFQRMLHEPKSKQRSLPQLQQFVVLNHILFSNIANVARTLLSKGRKRYPAEITHVAKRAYGKLDESSKKLGEEMENGEYKMENVKPVNDEGVLHADDKLLQEQLTFIYNVSKDIDRTTAVV